MAGKPRSTQSMCEDRSLGMSAAITRRDFLNTSLLGTGAALMQAGAPLELRADDSAVGRLRRRGGLRTFAWEHTGGAARRA